MACRLGLILWLLAVAGVAHAQSSPGFQSNTKLPAASLNAAFVTKMDQAGGIAANATLNTSTLNSPILNNVSINSGNIIGTVTGGTLSGTTLVNATFIGSTGTPNQTSVSCGTSATALLAVSSAIAFIAVKVPATAPGPVWFNWAGSNAVTAPPSTDVPQGAEIVWSTSNGFLPTSAVSCIAAGAPITVTLLWK